MSASMVPVSSSLPVHDKGRKVGVTPYAEDAIPEVLDCLKKSDFQMPAPSAPTDVHWLPLAKNPMEFLITSVKMLNHFCLQYMQILTLCFVH